MKIYAYEYCCYIMVVNKNITRDYFLEKAGIHGGYAKDMFCRLYDSIFAESENLLDSYGKYFHQEFSSLDEMLEKKYEPTLKSKACLKCLYFTKIISDLCRYLEYFSYLYTIN